MKMFNAFFLLLLPINMLIADGLSGSNILQIGNAISPPTGVTSVTQYDPEISGVMREKIKVSAGDNVFARDEIFFFNYLKRGADNKQMVTVLGGLEATLKYASELKPLMAEQEILVYGKSMIPSLTLEAGKLVELDIEADSLKPSLDFSDTRRLMCGLDDQYCLDDGVETVLGRYFEDFCKKPGSGCTHVPVQCVGCCLAKAPCCGSCTLSGADVQIDLSGVNRLLQISR